MKQTNKKSAIDLSKPVARRRAGVSYASEIDKGNKGNRFNLSKILDNAEDVNESSPAYNMIR